MHRAFLPFSLIPSHEACDVLGGDLNKVAILAMRAVLRHRKTVEIAHQQIRYGKHDLAFSCRVTSAGNLILELDIGDPRLSDRIILEQELQDAGRKAKGINRR